MLNLNNKYICTDKIYSSIDVVLILFFIDHIHGIDETICIFFLSNFNNEILVHNSIFMRIINNLAEENYNLFCFLQYFILCKNKIKKKYRQLQLNNYLFFNTLLLWYLNQFNMVIFLIIINEIIRYIFMLSPLNFFFF